MADTTEEKQTARAVARYERISPKKARPVIDLIRNKPVATARSILKFTNKKAARLIEKVLNSAVANATHNFDMFEEDLYIAEAYVDEGPTLKRWKARARGMASPIRKRTSHITIILAEREEV